MTDKTKQAWERLKLRLLADHSDIEIGKMMSAEALTHRGKVFVFHSTKGGRAGLGARIGRAINPETFGLSDWQYLAPFKTKPPMKDWIVVGNSDQAIWHKVAEFGLGQMRENVAKGGSK